MVSELITLPGDPPEAEMPAAPKENEPADSLRNPDAMSSAFWASSADATDPVRMIVSDTVRA